MSQVHETAYPTLPSEISDAELLAAFTPSAAELRFVRGQFRQMPTCVVILTQLKLLQRLGYFPLVSSVPTAIVVHIGKVLKARPLPKTTLVRYDKSGSKSRHQKLLREFVGIQPADADAQTWLATLIVGSASMSTHCSNAASRYNVSRRLTFGLNISNRCAPRGRATAIGCGFGREFPIRSVPYGRDSKCRTRIDKFNANLHELTLLFCCDCK